MHAYRNYSSVDFHGKTNDERATLGLLRWVCSRIQFGFIHPLKGDELGQNFQPSSIIDFFRQGKNYIVLNFSFRLCEAIPVIHLAGHNYTLNMERMAGLMNFWAT